MWARIPIVLAAVTTLLRSGTLLADAEGPHVRLRFAATYVRYLVERAIAGGRERLADPQCQQVLADSQDQNANSLLANLTATGKSPAEYLDDLWWFIDATDARPCQPGDLLVACTSPGHWVVYVCGSRFVHPIFRLDRRIAELLISHELLRSLGLSENPPTSDQITKQVARRCNG